MGNYKTLKENSSAYFKNKGSKFWAYAFPVNDIREVKSAIDEVRVKHPSSGHYCYAYKIGTGSDEITRVNDDGEPKGSAGSPILNQIKSATITYTLIVIARDFGGTKLGISGLISAYKTAAIGALKEGKIIEKEIQVLLQLRFKYKVLGEIRSILDRKNIDVVKATYNDFVCFNIQINKSDINEKRNLFIHLEVEMFIREM